MEGDQGENSSGNQEVHQEEQGNSKAHPSLESSEEGTNSSLGGRNATQVQQKNPGNDTDDTVNKRGRVEDAKSYPNKRQRNEANCDMDHLHKRTDHSDIKRGNENRFNNNNENNFNSGNDKKYNNRNNRGAHKHERSVSRGDSNQDPILTTFEKFSKLYDEIADTGELIFQNSRNITRDSKKVVSSLHRFHGHNVHILEDAEIKLKTIVNQLMKKNTEYMNPIGKMAYFLFLPKFQSGLEEFIEAFSFLWFFKFRQLVTLEQVREFTNINVDAHTYVCGIADLGGEMMRYSTSSISRGDTGICFEIAKFLSELTKGFMFLPIEDALDRKDKSSFTFKLTNMQQSTEKCEKLLAELTLREVDKLKVPIVEVEKS